MLKILLSVSYLWSYSWNIVFEVENCTSPFYIYVCARNKHIFKTLVFYLQNDNQGKSNICCFIVVYCYCQLFLGEQE